MVEEAFVVTVRDADALFEERLDADVDMGDEVLAQLTAGIGEAGGKPAGFRHQQQADALHTGAGDHHHPALRDALDACFAIEIADFPDAGRIGSNGQFIARCCWAGW